MSKFIDVDKEMELVEILSRKLAEAPALRISLGCPHFKDCSPMLQFGVGAVCPDCGYIRKGKLGRQYK